MTEYQGNYLRSLRAEQDGVMQQRFTRKQLTSKSYRMRTQPQARATKQQARINRFNDLKADLSGTTQSTGLKLTLKQAVSGKSYNFEDVPFAFLINKS